MYHTHFGLERSLFGDGIASETAVFRTPKHDRLIEQFKLALASPSSSIVLKGPAGIGKTTVTSMALRASSTRLAIAWVGGMATNSAELLELILVELGVNTLRTTRIERLQLWRQFQGEMRATDSRLFVVVERTEDLSHEVLHALDQLTAPDAAGNAGANLVLLGHPGVEEHIAPSLLDSLRQRIRLHTELEPFTEAELQDYLRHQVACVGGHFDRIFAPGAVASLHRYTKGVARLVNTLCESALELAAAQHQRQLTAELIATTAVSQLKLAEPAASGPVRAAVEPAAAAPAVAAAPPVPAAAVAPIQPAPAPAPAPKPQPPAASMPPPVQPQPIEVEYDGSATDVADVALADFPVLTDAVELPEPIAKRPTSIPAPAVAAAAPLSAPKQGSKPANRIETAYATARPAQAPSVPQPPAQRTPTVKAAPTAAQASTLVDPDEDDVLRQTQSMRAIAVAKSIDDLSELDAETLFGDAGLDLVSAALASAADWPDDELDAAAAAAAPAPRTEPEAKKAPLPADDPFDFFGLGEDAPLELIDDSAPPPSDRAAKAAVR
jgi:general secretion pathway protein A